MFTSLSFLDHKLDSVKVNNRDGKWLLSKKISYLHKITNYFMSKIKQNPQKSAKLNIPGNLALVNKQEFFRIIKSKLKTILPKEILPFEGIVSVPCANPNL